MTTATTLEQIFGAFVVQGTLEEAADMMADLSNAYPDMKDEFVQVLRCGITAAQNGDASIIQAINRSGYQAEDLNEASQYCEELLKLYEDRINGHI